MLFVPAGLLPRDGAEEETSGEGKGHTAEAVGSPFYQQLRTPRPRTTRPSSQVADDDEDFGPPPVPRRRRAPTPAPEPTPEPATVPTPVKSPVPSPGVAPTPSPTAPAQPEVRPAADKKTHPRPRAGHPIHKQPQKEREKEPAREEGSRSPVPEETIDLPRAKKSPPVTQAPTVPDKHTRPNRMTPDRTPPVRAAPTREASIADEPPADDAPVVERGDFRVKAPSYYRGIYINNAFFRSKQFPAFLKTAAASGMNTLVIDIQPSLPSAEVMKAIHEAGFYTVARVVVFPDGLKTYPAPNGYVERIMDRCEQGAKSGFAEVQLDYIRFADNLHVPGLTLEKRYRYLSGLLRRFEERLRPYRVRLGGDIFGRIAFNRNDIIGQKIEVFDAHLDTIYPMLYPSHFYGDAFRRRQPYRTVLDGTRDSRSRARNSRIIPYIQAFSMKVGESGLSLDDYIRAQIDGAKDAGGGGYIVWNARNDYRPFFRALGKGRLIQSTARKESVDLRSRAKNQSL